MAKARHNYIIRKMTILRFLLLSLLYFVATSPSWGYAYEGLNPSNYNYNLKVGATTTISLGTTYANVLQRSSVISYSYKSTNTSVATVTTYTKNRATIKGMGVGKCKIQYDCTYNQDGYIRKYAFHYDVTVTAATVLVTNVTLNVTSATLEVGGTRQLTATVYPTNATNRNVNWSTSLAAVATVSSSGMVTAKGVGTATIYCNAADGSGKRASCSITVVSRQKQEQTLGRTTLPEVVYGANNSRTVCLLNKTTNEGLTLTWSVADTEVASISSLAGTPLLAIRNAGTTKVTATQAGNDDYMPFVREFTFIVKKAPLTISVSDCAKVQGEENPEFTINYSGFVYNETSDGALTKLPTVTTSATTNSPEGGYSLIVDGAEARNYEIVYNNGNMTVCNVQRGDANGDGTITVTDIAVVVNRILQLDAEGGYETGLDANRDGQITVTDIGVIVDKILGTKTSANSRKMEQEMEPQ